MNASLRYIDARILKDLLSQSQSTWRFPRSCWRISGGSSPAPTCCRLKLLHLLRVKSRTSDFARAVSFSNSDAVCRKIKRSANGRCGASTPGLEVGLRSRVNRPRLWSAGLNPLLIRQQLLEIARYFCSQTYSRTSVNS